jgi:hypothetical protein
MHAMKTGRTIWLALGVVESLASIGSFLLLGVIQAFVGMVIMDWTARLKHEGLVSQERWDALIDGMAPHLRQAFALGTLVPVTFMILALVHFFIAWRCGPREKPCVT